MELKAYYMKIKNEATNVDVCNRDKGGVTCCDLGTVQTIKPGIAVVIWHRFVSVRDDLGINSLRKAFLKNC